MHFPRTPVERLQDFRPRFCPRPDCAEHGRRAGRYGFLRDGSYRRRTGRRVPRFRCRTCGAGFSLQSFATSYYMKRPDLLRPIAAGLVAGSAHRQIARSLGCAPSTVTRLAARLGRHAMLVQALALEALHGRVDESIPLDHLGSFEGSQDYPVDLGTAAGDRSWFIFTVDPAPHARAGRRSPAQEQRLRRRPKRDHRGGFAGSARRLVHTLLELTPPDKPLRLVSDAKPDYAHALARHPEARRLDLRAYPNPVRGPKGSPRSAAARERDRAMFVMDALHQLLRHSLAHLRRETIAFARRINALMERLFVFVVWRNFIKGVSERRPDPTTPAQRIGLAREPWSWPRVLSRRLFPGRVKLPAVWAELYRREWTSPLLRSNTRHDLVHAG